MCNSKMAWSKSSSKIESEILSLYVLRVQNYKLERAQQTTVEMDVSLNTFSNEIRLPDR